MGTKRLKRQRREMMDERARMLGPTTMVAAKGGRLKPGTPEHRQAVQKIASMLSEEEYQGLVTSKAGARGPGGRLIRRRTRPT